MSGVLAWIKCCSLLKSAFGYIKGVLAPFRQKHCKAKGRVTVECVTPQGTRVTVAMEGELEMAKFNDKSLPPNMP